jgi:hypothetical protein
MSWAAAMPGTVDDVLYQATIASTHRAGAFTPRVVPHCPEARVPTEVWPILSRL